MFSLRERLSQFWEGLKELTSHRPYLVAGVVILLLAGAFYGLQKYHRGASVKGTSDQGSDILAPAIINGQLVLPKVINDKSGSGLSNFSSTQLAVLNANLIGIFDQQQQKLSAIRIIGETQNQGGSVVTGFSPYIRFLDSSGSVVGQKLGSISSGFDFLGLATGATTYYDVTVPDPPTSDKLEIVLNVSSSTVSAAFEPLKIEGRNINVKTATYQGGNLSNNGNASNASHSSNSTSSATASPSATPPVAPDQIQYYTVTGSVINVLTDPVSDITVYSWIKDPSGKVFSFGRQDFKNDLLNSGDKLDFRINLLPFKNDEVYDQYEIAAWGKRYKLGV